MWCTFSLNEFIALSLQVFETTSFSWLEAELILTDVIWNRRKIVVQLRKSGKKTLNTLFVRKRTDLNLPLLFLFVLDKEKGADCAQSMPGTGGRGGNTICLCVDSDFQEMNLAEVTFMFILSHQQHGEIHQTKQALKTLALGQSKWLPGACHP